MSEYLFVYGTLRAGAAHPMHHHLAHGASPEGAATFPGRLYDLGRYPAAVAAEIPTTVSAIETPKTGEGWQVAGELWRLHDAGRLLPRLDEYEGCAASQPPPHEYRREQRDVRRWEGARVSAWIYLYIPSPRTLPQIESGDYLQWMDCKG